MRNKSVIRIFALILSLLMLCAVLVSCSEGIVTPEPPKGNGTGTPSNGDNGNGGNGDKLNKEKYYNTSASCFYTVDAAYTNIMRYDYNQKGDFLGATLIDAYTMAPMYSDIDMNRTFWYDENGKLERITFSGPCFNMTVASDGLSAEGTVDYSGQKITAVVKYGADGRLTTEEYWTEEDGVKMCMFAYNYSEDGTIKDASRNNGMYVGTYTTSSNTLKIELKRIDGQESEVVESYELVYDDNGNITKLSESGTVRMEWTYDANGRCISSKDDVGNVVCTMSYDDKGRISKAIGTQNSDTYKSDYTYTYLYNDAGDILTYAERNKSEHKDGEYVYKYDDEGIITFFYNEKGIFNGYSSKSVDYDEQENVTSVTESIYNAEFERVEKIETTFGVFALMLGKEEKHTFYDDGREVKENTYVYDKNGKLYSESERIYTNKEIDDGRNDISGYHVSYVETVKYYGDILTVKDYMTKKQVITAQYDDYGWTVEKMITVTEIYDENGKLTDTSTETTYPNQIVPDVPTPENDNSKAA